jgi:mono/diheme cytochrome c family protein
MSNKYLPQKYRTFSSLAVALSAFLFTGNAVAEKDPIGADEYRVSCLTCHGADGKGNGPTAKYLTVKPADLTVLSKNNTGQYPDFKAGTFPFFHVFQVIDGRTLVAAHGDRSMPIWGNRYQQDAGETYGPMGSEKAIRGRILELVYYIQGIQQ